MRLSSLIKQLPISLLVSVLVVSASAIGLRDAGSGIQQITSEEDFKTKDLLFVEFYLPTCTHCKEFAAMWNLLFKASLRMDGVSIAQVDCSLSQDICTSSGVTRVPTMIMYKDGLRTATYEGDIKTTTLDDLLSFVKKFSKSETPRGVVNPTGQVLELSPESFAAIQSTGPMFVKFFAPWCGHCKKLAPTWKQLARHMQSKLTIAEVNCDVHGSLCKSHNVEGYPTLLYFPEDGQAIEYNGGRGVEQLKLFAENATAGGVKGIRPEQLDTLVAEHDVLYLLLHSASDAKILDKVHKAAGPLLGSPPIFSSSSPALLSRFSIPATSTWALVALKDHDPNIPSSIFHENTSTDKTLKFWLLSHRLSTVMELTRDTFQKVMNAPQEPLVVIAAVTQQHKDNAEERLREVGKKWRIRTSGTGMIHGREVLFTWMDMDKWADWLKTMYGIKISGTSEDVPVIISDHKRLIYYDQDSSDSPIRFESSISLFSAVEAAAAGNLSYKHSENLIERMARYLNMKMTSFADYVVTYPLRSVFFLFVALGLVAWALKRLIANDLPAEDEYRASKTHRLD